MYKIIKYDDIDNNKIDGTYILIDVRSPKEYESETIPGAINIPIFDNIERKLVGTTYVQQSRDSAKKIGIKAASLKLPDIYDQISELNKQYDKVILFCARGGFRSSSLVSLFMTIGVNIFKLDNGYKGYRQYINKHLPKISDDIKYIVLYGNTGTGKTEILNFLEEKGYNTLDLEGCANHRGSILGSVGLGEQSTQKMFESLVYDSLKNRKSNIVFIEGESRKIGKITIPESIYTAMGEGIHLEIYADINKRIEIVLKDYVHGTDKELINSLNYLRQQLSNRLVNKYISMIKSGNYKPVIKELMTDYYDSHYDCNSRKHSASFENKNSETTADNIIKWINK